MSVPGESRREYALTRLRVAASLLATEGFALTRLRVAASLPATEGFALTRLRVAASLPATEGLSDRREDFDALFPRARQNSCFFCQFFVMEISICLLLKVERYDMVIKNITGEG